MFGFGFGFGAALVLLCSSKVPGFTVSSATIFVSQNLVNGDWIGDSLCRVSFVYSSVNFSPFLEQDLLGILCISGSRFSTTPVAVMQNTKIVEPFTAHYVFALGVARFLSCAHWVLQVLDTRGHLLVALGYGLWPSMVLISEIVQTFILADFCYYYVKSVFGGQLVLRLPSGVV
ncbi:hypothetical protein CFP56_006247 [Quercus suber]|uniref:Uncharacterized protein n=1 Tax=Quercus suber TaxID=58331 RepID=A0AAW0L8B0_QUESU